MDRLFVLVALCIASFLLVILEYNYLDMSEIDGDTMKSMGSGFLARLSFGKSFLMSSNELSRFESHQWKAVDRLVSACQSLGLEVILIDPNVLWKMTLERGNRSQVPIPTSSHVDPFGCRHLCDLRLILGVEVQDGILDALKAKLDQQLIGLYVSHRRVLDTRGNTLESVATMPSLLSHVFVLGNSVSLQLVLFHVRGNRLWHGLCDDSREHGADHRSVYCQREHLIKRFVHSEKTIDGVRLQLPAKVNAFLVDLRDSAFTPCDYNNARRFYSSYGVETDEQAGYFRSQAAILLLQTKSVLDRMDIKFWLSSGTCLGWFRQCDFITHSKDVDIGIFIKDYKPQLIDAFKDAGMKLTHRFGKVEDSFELSFKSASGLKLDIFFFYEENNSIWNGGTQAKTGKKFKYSFPRFSLCLTEFVDAVVRVPCPARPYIEANYGPAWHEMVKEWDWKKSPPNVAENGVWAEADRSQVIQLLNQPAAG